MMSKKEEKEFERRMQLQRMENEVAANQNRARSVTVGTAFGGVTEIMMRKFDGSVTWATMQPVEVMELIHQLSANIGCHIHVQPRKDFASWRDWKPSSQEELEHLNGHPPFASDMIPHELRGRVLPKPEKQPGLLAEDPKDDSNTHMLTSDEEYKLTHDEEQKLKDIKEQHSLPLDQ
jgi:hypothetical protein